MTTAAQSARTSPASRRAAPPRGSAVGDHGLFIVFLVTGAVLRALAQIAYTPALLYYDSFGYLENAGALLPTGLRPLGYSALFLRWLLPFGDLAVIPFAQHLLGLGMGGLVYALLLRRGVARWLAALAAAPVLLDGYQIQIEQYVMSDALFCALLVGALALLTWRPVPSVGAAAAAGLLLGLGATVRLVGQLLIVVALAAVLWAEPTWRRRLAASLALFACFTLPLLVYAARSAQVTGDFGIDSPTGRVVYARVAPFADCAQLAASGVPSYLGDLCPPEPVGQRMRVDDYVHAGSSPARTVALPPGVDREEALADFGWQVIRNQPLDVAGVVLRDFVKGFAPYRVQAPEDVSLERWRFQTEYVYFSGEEAARDFVARYGGDGPAVRPLLGTALRAYQFVGYAPGTLLGLGALLGLAGAAFAGRRAGRSLRPAALLFALTGLALLGQAAAFEFSWRYQLPALVLFPPAAALGATALLRRLRIDAAENAAVAAAPDAVDAAALAAFQERYGGMAFAPVVVVIAAYNEADAIGPVLTVMPERTGDGHGGDLAVDVLVVVDGASDDTAAVARAAGAYVCEAPRNRGQGAALRLGYRLAADRGARYLVTTDADGQYDSGELPTLLEPLLHDEADFVTGSRVLGRRETSDPMRHLGVHVFARLVSALTRRRVTDTSFGLRAMKAHVPTSVTLAQPQYQSSELLLGVLAAGYRVAERPATMRARTAGQTKKGGNLRYGLRYAGVVLSTWLRQDTRRGRSLNT